MIRALILTVLLSLLGACSQAPVAGYITKKTYTPAQMTTVYTNCGTWNSPVYVPIMSYTPPSYRLQVRIGQTGELVNFEVPKKVFYAVQFGDWFDPKERGM